MKNVKLNIRKLGVAGFSLIEMLVVIAVIGVIAAIAIPNIGNINDAARNAKGASNARNVCSVWNGAVAAGYTVVAGDKTVSGVINKLASTGATPSQGSFAGNVFVVPNIPQSTATGEAKVDYDKMAGHLTFDAASLQLTYND
jgi:type IV pilus assembly protein PilA